VLRFQVVNELEVFDAVTKWIESSLETRLSLLCHLLGEFHYLDTSNSKMVDTVAICSYRKRDD
jgi:hypothetical protein